MRFEGPIARQNQFLFASDWMEQVDENLDAYLREPIESSGPGFTAQAFGTGPIVRFSAMPEMFETLMYAAREDMVITSPYYVPTESMQDALCASARRGVDTRIVFPARNDSWVVEAGAYGAAAQFIIWVIGFELALHIIGIRLTTLFATAGFFAVAAGVAAKSIVADVLSGAILRLERIIRSGDLIVVKDKPLIVQRVGMRIMKARTFDGEEILIPNSLIAESMVENLTRNDRLHRIQIRVGVVYESDLTLVRKTLEQTIDQLEWRSAARIPEVFLREFGDSSVNYDIDVWIDEVSDYRVRMSDLHESAWWALKGKGITIAFPQLDLHLDQNVVDAVAKQNLRPAST